jgi:zinc protease
LAHRARFLSWHLRAAVITVLLAGFSTSATATVLKVEQIESPRGIKAWLVEEHSIPLVAIRFSFTGGSTQDAPGKAGVASLMADLLGEGAGDLSAAQFKERTAVLGARLSVFSRRDAIHGSLDTVAARLKPSGDLLRLMLTSPHFAAADVDRVKAQRLTDIARAANDPTKVALQSWYGEAFAGHPYANPVDGTAASITSLTIADLKNAHASLFAKDTLKVVIVGDINKAAAREMLDAVFGELPNKARLVPAATVKPRAAELPIVVERDLPLATAAFGLASLPVNHPDYAALQVLNHIIGSGDFDSRLMDEIRVKRGLAYSIQTSLEQEPLASVMLGAFATKNENMQPALRVVREVLARTASGGPTPAEFENAKQYLTGSFLLDYDTSGRVAASLMRIWLDGEGPEAISTRRERINKVALADVKRVAQQVLQADRLLVTIVGKPTPP